MNLKPKHKSSNLNIKLIIFLFCVFANPFGCLFAQINSFEEDSLVAKLSTLKTDTLIARQYLKIVNFYASTNPEKAINYCRAGIAYCTQMPWPRGIGVFNSNLASLYSDFGSFDSSIYYQNKAIEIYTTIKDSVNICSELINKGVLVQNLKSDYVNAINYYMQALSLAKKLNLTYYIALSYKNLSSLFVQQSDLKKALDYAFLDLNICKSPDYKSSLNPTQELGRAYADVGIVYVSLKQYENAVHYLDSAIHILESISDYQGLAGVYQNKALCLGDDYPQVIAYALRAKEIYDQINPLINDAITNTGNLGLYYYHQLLKFPNQTRNKNNSLILAIKYIKEAIQLCQSKNDIEGESFWKGNLSEIQEYTGDYKNAYLNFKFYKNIYDSLYSQEYKNIIAKKEVEQELKIKDQEIEINKLTITNQKKLRYALLIGLGMLTFIGFLIWNQSQDRKRKNAILQKLNDDLDMANKNKSKFLAVLSHDIRSPLSNLINFIHLQNENPDIVDKAVLQKNQNLIEKSAENLLENIERILIWSKSQMEKFAPKKTKLKVNSLYEYIKTQFEPYDIEFIFENKEDIQIYSDEDCLLTIMLNLTANAVKALHDTTNPKIIWTANYSNSGYQLIIQDNGPGLPTNILNSFNQNNLELGGKFGFGLSIIKDLTKVLNLTIIAQNIPQKGTQFIISDNLFV